MKLEKGRKMIRSQVKGGLPFVILLEQIALSFGWVLIWMLHSKLLQNSLVVVFCTRHSLTDPTRSFCLVLDPPRGSQMDEVCPLTWPAAPTLSHSRCFYLTSWSACMFLWKHTSHIVWTQRHFCCCVGGVLVVPNGYIWEHLIHRLPNERAYTCVFDALHSLALMWITRLKRGRERDGVEQTWVLRLLLCHICCFMCCFLSFTRV